MKTIVSLLRSLAVSLRSAVAHDTEVRRLQKQHAGLFNWLRARVAHERFTGLPLTVAVIMVVYYGLLFAGIAEDVITADVTTLFDIRLANLLADLRTPAGIRFFTAVTVWGNTQMVLAAVAAGMAMLLIWRRYWEALAFFVTVFGAEATTLLAKMMVARPRPLVALYPEHTFAFPSGHATVAVALYGFIAVIAMRCVSAARAKIAIAAAGVLFVAMLGFSRLYLGVHFASDVWGGFLVGGIWLVIGVTFAVWRQSLAPSRRPLRLHRFRQVASGSILIGVGTLYAVFVAAYYPPAASASIQARVIAAGDVLSQFGANALPRFTETITGQRQEPLSFIVTAPDDAAFTAAFERAGWQRADSLNDDALGRALWAGLLNESYPQAPMTPSFWNGQPHDFGFEKATPTDSIRQRHHARFWRTPLVTESGARVYVGTASLDSGVKWGVTHTIAPAIDTERDTLYHNLKNAGVVTADESVVFVEPVLGKNFAGDAFFTDGEAYRLSF